MRERGNSKREIEDIGRDRDDRGNQSDRVQSETWMKEGVRVIE